MIRLILSAIIITLIGAWVVRADPIAKIADAAQAHNMETH